MEQSQALEYIAVPKCRNCNSQYELYKGDHGGANKHKKILKIPLLLECGHVYCSACINLLFKSRCSLPCPQCNIPTPLIKGVSLFNQLPISYHLLGIVAAHYFGLKCLITVPFKSEHGDNVEQLEKECIPVTSYYVPSTSVGQLCQECEHYKANLECMKCDCILCTECFNTIHSSSKILRGHQGRLLKEQESNTDTQLKSQLQVAVKTSETQLKGLNRTLMECIQLIKGYQNNKSFGQIAIENEMRQLMEAKSIKLLRELAQSTDRERIVIVNYSDSIVKTIKEKRALLSKGIELLKNGEKLNNIEQLIEGLTAPLDSTFDSIPQTNSYHLSFNKELYLKGLNESYYIIGSSVEERLNVSDLVKIEEKKGEEKVDEKLSSSELDTSLLTQEEEEKEEEKQTLNISINSNTSLQRELEEKDEREVEEKREEKAILPLVSVDSVLVKSTSLSPHKKSYFSSSPSKSAYTSSSRDSSPSGRGSGCGLRTTNTSSSAKVSEEENNTESAVHVTVSHVESPSDFYIQYSEQLELLTSLEERISKEKLVTKSSLLPNMTYVLYTNDHQWRRCQIESFHDQDYISIILFDYGNTEMVSTGSVYSLPSHLSSIPSYAHHCTLADVQPLSASSGLHVTPLDWNQTSKSFFKSITVGQKGLTMKVISEKKGKLTVNLIIPSSSGGLSISSHMIKLGKAQRMKKKKKQNPTPKKAPAVMFPLAEPLPFGSTLPILMITAPTPYDFYIQLADRERELRSFCSKIQQLCMQQKAPHVYNRESYHQVGSLVLAPYEREYYRAIIINKSKRCYTVQFIDYGNTQTFNEPNFLPITDEQVATTPPYTYRCKLFDVIWREGNSWPEYVCEKFHLMTTSIEHNLLMTVHGIDSNNVLLVTLRDGLKEVGISEFLVKENLAKFVPVPLWVPPSPHYLSLGQKEQVLVSHVESPSSFHIQLSKEQLSFNKLQQTLNPSSTPLSFIYKPFKGTYCLALFHADHNYHRGYIEGCDKDKYNVYFIDYGNRSSLFVSDLFPLLNKEFISLPAQAISCCLSGCEGREWSFDECVEFSRLVLEKEFTLVVKAISNPLLVDLYTLNDNINITNIMEPPLLTNHAPSTPLPPGFDHTHINEASNSLPNLQELTPITNHTPNVIDDSTVISDDVIDHTSNDVISHTPNDFYNHTPRSNSPVYNSHSLPTLFSSSPSNNISSPPPPLLSLHTTPTKSTLVKLGNNKSRLVECYKPADWPTFPFEAIVTCVSDKGQLYAQPFANNSNITELIEAINDAVTTSTPPNTNISTVYINMPCLAPYEGEWYRGVVMDIKYKDDNVLVHFVDYGNSDVVPVQSIIPVLVAPDIPILVLSLKRLPLHLSDKFEHIIEQDVLVDKDNNGDITLLVNNQSIEQFLAEPPCLGED